MLFFIVFISVLTHGNGPQVGGKLDLMQDIYLASAYNPQQDFSFLYIVLVIKNPPQNWHSSVPQLPLMSWARKVWGRLDTSLRKRCNLLDARLSPSLHRLSSINIRKHSKIQPSSLDLFMEVLRRKPCRNL